VKLFKQAGEYSIEIWLDPETDCTVREFWRNQQNEFEAPDDRPAMAFFCPKTRIREQARWMKAGELHRANDLPSQIITSPITGAICVRQWSIDGNGHRDGDNPSYEVINLFTGNPEELHFEKWGKFHRIGAGAVQYFDPQTGKLTKEYFWENGVQLPNKSGSPKPSIT